LRHFISRLETEGELVRINEEVDWKYEIGEKTRLTQKSDLKPPALLFENVKGYQGHRILTNGLSSYSKIAIALDLPPLTPFKDIVKAFMQRISNPVQPVMINDGSVTKNILLEKDIDLMRLPVPWWSKEDGGRYIGTWHLNITKDPETGVRNIGIYRMQLLGPRTTAISISPKSHLAVHLSKAEKENKPLDMAVAIGVDENLIMAAAASPPYGIDEYCLAGGLNQRTVELIRCHTVDLEVPASAEIVIEGKILPKLKIKEGPFLDYSGIPRIDSNALVFEVSCLMYRDNPIFRGATIGTPAGEDHLLFSLLSHAGYLDFHGSRIRQKIQNILLQRSLFKSFQFLGGLSQYSEAGNIFHASSN
jgi:UbiD family decarboxylase